MTLRGILRKKDKHPDPTIHEVRSDSIFPSAPEFTFLRTTTHSEEVLTPPSHPGDVPQPAPVEETRNRFSRLGFKSRSRATSGASQTSPPPRDRDSEPSRARPLSRRLHLKRETSSSNIPANLPAIDGNGDSEHAEEQWEARATMLAKSNEMNRSRPASAQGPGGQQERSIASAMNLEVKGQGGVGNGERVVGDKRADDNIQEAIKLHEAGKLEQATGMFGRLADPGGENNALSQVLYALALRHGWGCEADPEKAMQYLSAAASNAASIEDQALSAGSKKGGAAKGELVLAIFELANSFRHGWGVKKDPIAAKQYYETAANLGDTDAMNEVGWCYLEGFGCKKDKMQSAKYYRLAEKGGSKILGNTWIWKPKYDPLV